MFDVTIIGGGPGGYVAAIHAAHLGGKVALVEAGALGGTCLNRGCIPTKALVKTAELLNEARGASRFGVDLGEPRIDFARAMARKDQVVADLVGGIEGLMRANGVSVYRGRGSILTPGQVQVRRDDGTGETIETKNIIIATGSAPARPPIPGMDLPGVITSDEALALDRLPASLVIVGGGVIGIEFACIFNALGTRVTVVEMLPMILPPADEEIVRRLAPILRKSGIEVITGAKVQGIRDAGGAERAVAVETAAGSQELKAEAVLVSTGRVPDFGGLDLDGLGVAYDRRGIKADGFMRTSVPDIYAVGDVTGGILLAHVASAEGITAVDHVFGRAREIDYRVVPNCIFSIPEVAGAGLTEKQAKEAGLEVTVSKFPFAAIGKAQAMGETEGIVKILAETATGRVVGVHILGPHASDLIHEGALAIQLGATAVQVAGMIHAHPTLPEAIMEAAHGVAGQAIHVARARAR